MNHDEYFAIREQLKPKVAAELKRCLEDREQHTRSLEAPCGDALWYKAKEAGVDKLFLTELYRLTDWSFEQVTKAACSIPADLKLRVKDLCKSDHGEIYYPKLLARRIGDYETALKQALSFRKEEANLASSYQYETFDTIGFIAGLTREERKVLPTLNIPDETVRAIDPQYHSNLIDLCQRLKHDKKQLLAGKHLDETLAPYVTLGTDERKVLTGEMEHESASVGVVLRVFGGRLPENYSRVVRKFRGSHPFYPYVFFYPQNEEYVKEFFERIEQVCRAYPDIAPNCLMIYVNSLIDGIVKIYSKNPLHYGEVRQMKEQRLPDEQIKILTENTGFMENILRLHKSERWRVYSMMHDLGTIDGLASLQTGTMKSLLDAEDISFEMKAYQDFKQGLLDVISFGGDIGAWAAEAIRGYRKQATEGQTRVFAAVAR